MQIIARGRQGGKTKAMLDWMEEAPEGEVRVCVSATTKRAMHLLRRSRDEERSLESWQFISAMELPNYRPVPVALGWVSPVIGIDDADWVLQHLSRYPIGLITLTTEEDNGDQDQTEDTQGTNQSMGPKDMPFLP